MKKLEALVRPHILGLTPYSSARDEYSGKDGIFLDANENAFGSVIDEPYNRYPDPYQHQVKLKISRLKKIDPEQIFLGNGSDEPIDLLVRMFCAPGRDNIIVMPPTYDMYSVCAAIQEVEVRSIPLGDNYEMDVEKVLKAADANTKIIFICSPNNPTGNSFQSKSVERILSEFEGITVIDEAYIDFSAGKGYLHHLNHHDNLVILQTLSKAWGLAGLRLGMAFGTKRIIQILNKIKFPYNLSEATQKLALKALNFENRKTEMVKAILDQRSYLERELGQLPYVEKIFPSDANFLLVKFREASRVFQYLLERNIIVRNRSKLVLCENALRITTGTSEENAALISQLKNYPGKS